MIQIPNIPITTQVEEGGSLKKNSN